jgi:DNA-binding transcriptional LysR family regulator
MLASRPLLDYRPYFWTMAHNMDLLALKGFIAVVEEGSFSGAARALRQPKSTISKRVQSLEDDLAVRLLERTTRAVRLTPDGALLLERARQLTAEAEELRRSIRDRDTTPRGPLRVVCSTLFGQVYMGQIAAEFVKTWPETTLDVVFSDRPVDLVEGGFDCAIRATEDTDGSLVTRTFARARGLIVASPDLAARHADLDHPDGLRGMPTIGFAPIDQVMGWPLVRNGESVVFEPAGPLKLGGLSAIRDAALAGAGATGLPEFLVAEDLAAGRLVRLLPDWETPERALRLVFPSGRQQSARVRAFVDLITARFPTRRL